MSLAVPPARAATHPALGGRACQRGSARHTHGRARRVCLQRETRHLGETLWTRGGGRARSRGAADGSGRHPPTHRAPSRAQPSAPGPPVPPTPWGCGSLTESEGEAPDSSPGVLRQLGAMYRSARHPPVGVGSPWEALFKGCLDCSCVTPGDTRLGTGRKCLERGVWPWAHREVREGAALPARGTRTGSRGLLSQPPPTSSSREACAARGTGPSCLGRRDPALAMDEPRSRDSTRLLLSVCPFVPFENRNSLSQGGTVLSGVADTKVVLVTTPGKVSEASMSNGDGCSVLAASQDAGSRGAVAGYRQGSRAPGSRAGLRVLLRRLSGESAHLVGWSPR